MDLTYQWYLASVPIVAILLGLVVNNLCPSPFGLLTMFLDVRQVIELILAFVAIDLGLFGASGDSLAMLCLL